MAKKKHHTRRARGTSYKAIGLAAVAGVATVVGLGYAQTKIPFVRDHWYAAPLALGGGALLLSRRMPTIALALAAGAAIFGYMGYQADQTAQANKANEKSPNQGTAGYQDAGAYRRMAVKRDSGLHERNGNAGALHGARAGQMLFEQAGALMGPESRSIRTRSAAGSLSDM